MAVALDVLQTSLPNIPVGDQLLLQWVATCLAVGKLGTLNEEAQTELLARLNDDDMGARETTAHLMSDVIAESLAHSEILFPSPTSTIHALQCVREAASFVVRRATLALQTDTRVDYRPV